jgi:hypothetical protein
LQEATQGSPTPPPEAATTSGKAVATTSETGTRFLEAADSQEEEKEGEGASVAEDETVALECADLIAGVPALQPSKSGTSVPHSCSAQEASPGWKPARRRRVHPPSAQPGESEVTLRSGIFASSGLQGWRDGWSLAGRSESSARDEAPQAYLVEAAECSGDRFESTSGQESLAYLKNGQKTEASITDEMGGVADTSSPMNHGSRDQEGTSISNPGDFLERLLGGVEGGMVVATERTCGELAIPQKPKGKWKRERKGFQGLGYRSAKTSSAAGAASDGADLKSQSYSTPSPEDLAAQSLSLEDLGELLCCPISQVSQSCEFSVLSYSAGVREVGGGIYVSAVQ